MVCSITTLPPNVWLTDPIEESRCLLIEALDSLKNRQNVG
jgi:hypothetical protein